MKYCMRKQNKKFNSFVTNYTAWGEAMILLVRTLMAKCHNFPLRAVIMFNKMLLTPSVSFDGSSISFFTYKNMPDILREVYAIQWTAGFMQIKQFSKGLFVIFFLLLLGALASVCLCDLQWTSWEGDHCDSATLANMGWHAGDHWPGPYPRLPCNLHNWWHSVTKSCVPFFTFPKTSQLSRLHNLFVYFL